MRPSLEHCQATGGWEGDAFKTSPQQRPNPLPGAAAFVDTHLKAAALPAAFWRDVGEVLYNLAQKFGL